MYACMDMHKSLFSTYICECLYTWIFATMNTGLCMLTPPPVYMYLYLYVFKLPRHAVPAESTEESRRGRRWRRKGQKRKEAPRVPLIFVRALPSTCASTYGICIHADIDICMDSHMHREQVQSQTHERPFPSRGYQHAPTLSPRSCL